MADEVGLKVIVSAHQDVWSRLCGGSGAPGWTFDVAGMDIRAFMETKSAYVHNLEDAAEQGTSDPREVKGPFVWPSGYQKLAAATLATLFWAGETFAWKLRLPVPDGAPVELKFGQQDVSVQEYLQSSFLHAFGTLSDALAHAPNVLGFEVLNEPHRGLIELHSWDSWKYETDLHIGHFPSLLQAVALGDGHKQSVPYYVRSWPWPTRVSHYSEVDPKGKSVWAGQSGCLWQRHGAWRWVKDTQKPVVVREDFFSHDPRPNDVAGSSSGRKIEWYRDFYTPFVTRFAERMRKNNTQRQVWWEPIPNEFHPPWAPSQVIADEEQRKELQFASTNQQYAVQTDLTDVQRPDNAVFSPHFYDLDVVFSKTYTGWMSVDVQSLSRGAFVLFALFFGESGLRSNYVRQLGKIVSFARLSLGEIPVVIGEIGIPFDLNGAEAFKTGDFTRHEELLDALANGMEKAGVSGWCWWNYNPDNVHGDGDYWNKEDFSVISRGDGGASHATPRAIAPLIRPYAVRLMGVPMSSDFNRRHGIFSLEYCNFARPIGANSEDFWNVIFLPQYHFARHDIEISVSDGEIKYDPTSASQTLLWRPANFTPGAVHKLRIEPVAKGFLNKALKRIGVTRLSGTDRLAVLAVLFSSIFIVYVFDAVVTPLLQQASQNKSLDV